MCEYALCSCREQHQEEHGPSFSVADGKVVESLEHFFTEYL